LEEPSHGPAVGPGFAEPLAASARQCGVALAPAQIQAYGGYLDLLLEWNQRFNLTAIADPQAVLVKHFLDSLSCAAVVEFVAVDRLVDVGTGAGFPGLVLKIAFPHLRVLLLDSVEKRLRFLDRVIDALGLEQVETLHARAEEAGRDPRWRGRFDVSVARAVARLSTLAEYCLPLVRVGGCFLAQKGPDVEEEIAEARPALAKLGGGEPALHPLMLPGTGIGRSLVRVPKIAPTPPDYPRLPGTPKKHPL
jgi:16S rRNA (guanine527-N7)-methyltransferase